MPVAQIQFGPFALENPNLISQIALLIGFLILAFLIWRFALPPIRTQLADRTTRIENIQAEADRHLAEARQIRDSYASRIAQIEIEHRARLDAAVHEAEAARTQIIADAGESARALRRRAEEEVARERTRQRILMRRQIVQITLDAAEQSVRDLDSEPAQRLLIADFITRVSAPQAAVARIGASDRPADLDGGASIATQRQIQTQGGA